LRGRGRESDPMPRRGGGRGAAKNGRRERSGAGARIAGFAVSASPAFPGLDLISGLGGQGGGEGGSARGRTGRLKDAGPPSKKGGVEGVGGWVKRRTSNG